MRFFIEPRARDFVEPEVIKLIEQAREEGSGLELTGQPVMETAPTLFHDDCSLVQGQLLLPQSLRLRRVPEVGHRHLAPRFLGEYAVLAAIDPSTGREFVLGIRKELGFEISEPRE